jgi:hypothetical protein
MQYDADQFGGHSRDEFVATLSAEGVPCSPGYTRPLSEEPALVRLREKYPDLIKRHPCPNVERICRRSVWLFQSMLLASRGDMDDVVEATAKIRDAFRADSSRVGE